MRAALSNTAGARSQDSDIVPMGWHESAQRVGGAFLRRLLFRGSPGVRPSFPLDSTDQSLGPNIIPAYRRVDRASPGVTLLRSLTFRDIRRPQTSDRNFARDLGGGFQRQLRV